MALMPSASFHLSAPVALGTLGMFILDTFSFIDPHTSAPLGHRGLDVQLGGGGLYFCVGARIFLPSSAIQMIIDAGEDFTPSIRTALDVFDVTPPGRDSEGGAGSMWHFRPRTGKTTRALNIYKGEQRGFEYLTPKVRLEVKDLLDASITLTPRLPRWIHMICSPQRAREIIGQIDAHLDSFEGQGDTMPKLVYEPIPDSCVAANLDDCLTLLDRLEVFSPNHEEAAALLGLTAEWGRICTTHTSKQQTDWIKTFLAQGFVDWARQTGVKGSMPIICIRSGKLGSVVGREGVAFQHVPPFYSQVDSSKVVDVTGAGNAYLGGFTAYLVTNQLQPSQEQEQIRTACREAAMHGSVAASLIIEQLGLPSFAVDEEEELWNGATIKSRLDALRRTMAAQDTADEA